MASTLLRLHEAFQLIEPVQDQCELAAVRQACLSLFDEEETSILRHREWGCATEEFKAVEEPHWPLERDRGLLRCQVGAGQVPSQSV